LLHPSEFDRQATQSEAGTVDDDRRLHAAGQQFAGLRLRPFAEREVAGNGGRPWPPARCDGSCNGFELGSTARDQDEFMVAFSEYVSKRRTDSGACAGD
jgi:hypothetical protein